MLKLISFLILSFQLFATDWYVDNTASGSNNGTSWTNAWESIGDINWASISAGDFIYISGGSVSKTYNENLAPQVVGTASNLITIIAGKYAPSPSGHSGNPILSSGVTFDEYGGVSPKYIVVKGFEITGASVSFDADVPSQKGITVDSCYIHDYGIGFGVRMIGYVDSCIIQNNTIIDCTEGGDCGGDRDCIHVNADGAKRPTFIIIRNNYVHSTSQDPTAHNDAIQSVECDGFAIYNNVFINDSVNSPEGGGYMIISSVDYNSDDTPPFLFFNNFCYMGGVWQAGANQAWTHQLRHDGSGNTWGEISPYFGFNNTFVSNGPRVRGVGNNGEGYPHLFVNNIISQYCLPDGATDWRTGETHGWMSTFEMSASYGHSIILDSIRSNIFWREDSTDGPQDGGLDPIITGDFDGGTLNYDSDWADWISIGGSGLFRDPLFDLPYGHIADLSTVSPDIKSNSPAIDAGEDLSYLPEYLAAQFDLPDDIKAAMYLDFYGNERGADGDWDIGAVEYQSEEPPAPTGTKKVRVIIIQ